MPWFKLVLHNSSEGFADQMRSILLPVCQSLKSFIKVFLTTEYL
jgi:hypothetical protein